MIESQKVTKLVLHEAQRAEVVKQRSRYPFIAIERAGPRSYLAPSDEECQHVESRDTDASTLEHTGDLFDRRIACACAKRSNRCDDIGRNLNRVEISDRRHQLEMTVH